jgi:hypothetical protein
MKTTKLVIVACVVLACMGSSAFAANLSRGEAKADIEGIFQDIDPATTLLWKSIDIDAPVTPTMYDMVQLHVPQNAEVFLVRAAFTTKSGDERPTGRDYVSYYEFYADDDGDWHAVQTAHDGVYESDPYYMN